MGTVPRAAEQQAQLEGWGPVSETASLAGYALIAWDADRRITRWTPRATELTGRPALDVLGARIDQILPESSIAEPGRWRPLTIAGAADLELLVLSAAGLPSPGALLRAAPPAATPAREAGSPAREALARSEEQFRAAVDPCPKAHSRSEGEGVGQPATPPAGALLGRDPAEIIGLTYRDFTLPADLPAARAADARLATGDPERVQYDKALVRGDGTTVWARLTIAVIPGPDGQPWRLLQAQDLTAERAAASASARELERLRATLAVQREVIAAAGDQTRVVPLMADRVVDLFEHADGATIALIDGNQLVMAGASGCTAAARGTRLPIAGTFTGAVLAGHAPASCPDTSVDPLIDQDSCARLDIRSLLMIPLATAGDALGVLTVCSSRPAAFDAADEQHLALLATSLSAALRHAEDAARNGLLLAERTDALASLEHSERRFRLTFDNSPLGVGLVSLRPATFGDYLQVNPALCAITGYSADELTSMNFQDLIHPDDTDTGVLPRIMAGDLDALGVERRYRHRDGHLLWVSIRLAVVRDENGRGLYLVNQVEDITAARAARARIEQQARMLELIPAAVIVRRLDGEILWWNAGAEHLYGRPAAAARGQITHRLLGTAFPGQSTADDQARALRDYGRWDGELRHRTADGRVVTVVSRQVVHHGDATTSAVLEINTDVSAERVTQAALAQSEQRFRVQFQHSAVGQIVSGLDGTLLDVNPAYAAMLGYGVDQLRGIAGAELMHPDDATASRAGVTALVSGQKAVHSREGRLRHADGHWIDAQATISLVRDPDGTPQHVVGVINDITARKAAERALAESEQRFRAQFTHSAVGQVVRDLDGRYLDVNPAFAAMLGRTREELIGVRGLSLVHPDDVTLRTGAASALAAGGEGASTVEGRLRHAGGHYVDVQATMSLVHDPEGRPAYFIGVVSDITTRKAAEAARDHAAAALAERNTELEQANQLKLDLIGMLGHDIGNPLTNILGYLETASDWENLAADRRSNLFDVIARQANRINDITQEVLAMVRIDAGTMHARRRVLPLLAEVDAALAAADAGAVPVIAPDPALLVQANPGHLQQILVNLLSNAAKYGGGATAVRVGKSAFEAGRVLVAVEDRGPGVPEEFRPQLFDRLTRARRDANTVQGTGLGLYIVRGLAQANGGDVHHEPHPDGGSIFVLELDAADPL